jgi:N-acetylglucosaminyldiphosphoundecaprenol N-acetyl-beta-D-mannosaminyltransferase
MASRVVEGAVVRPVPARQRLFGIDVDVVSGREALSWVGAAIDAGRTDLVLTPNVDHIVRFQRDPEFRSAYAGAGLVLPDSTPLMWAARALGRPLADRASNLMLDLCGAAAHRGDTVYLLGGSRQVVSRAVASLEERFPGIRVAGCHHGYVSEDDEDEVVRAVDRIAPDLLFVGMGSPKQELWMARNAGRMRHGVAVGVGGAFNYVAGEVSRAPAWVQGAGLEWFWRFAHEPRRLFRRYFVEDVAFLRLVAAEFARSRRSGRDPAAAEADV